jgi:DGQHR domain-containing protein
MPAEVLAECCFVSTRTEDPIEGFQRLLDKKRAQQIAEYIEGGTASIPGSIVLSAQREAALTIKTGGRALTFRKHPKAFLVLDGQHRLYGFVLAKQTSHELDKIRVPVIVYEGLSRQQESRLFIDINTKQRPVSNELLLDIKRMADAEGDEEALFRDVFDTFNSDAASVLLGLMSPTDKVSGKVSRVTFKEGMRTIKDVAKGRTAEDLYEILNAYLSAFAKLLTKISYPELLTTPMGFKAIVSFFPDVASRVKDKFDGDYSEDNFSEILGSIVNPANKAPIKQAKKSYKQLQSVFRQKLTKAFTL